MTTPRTALVTGASSGIGAALAPVLAARGYAVGVAARRADRLADVVEQCRALGVDAHAFSVDLEDPDAPSRLAADALEVFGGIGVLVNNAATPGVHHARNLRPEQVERVMRVNFHAPVALALALLPSMLEQEGGTIVNVSSLGGRLGINAEAAYCASKFALCGFSESLQLDLWDTPVNVRLIIPGAVDTEIWEVQGDDAVEHDIEKVPALDVAHGIADAIDSDRFEHYLPDMLDIALFKTKRIDDYYRYSIAALANTPDVN